MAAANSEAQSLRESIERSSDTVQFFRPHWRNFKENDFKHYCAFLALKFSCSLLRQQNAATVWIAHTFAALRRAALRCVALLRCVLGLIPNSSTTTYVLMSPTMLKNAITIISLLLFKYNTLVVLNTTTRNVFMHIKVWSRASYICLYIPI